MTARWSNLPTRCRCSHAAISHTGGSGPCWTHPCACAEFREPMRRGSLDDRMAARTSRTATCWIWTGDVSPDTGYGRLTYDGVRHYAHRLAYEAAKGPIPPGLVIDHLCRVRNCVNPDHLEPVTRRENTLRGEGYTAQRARATHCKRDHELSGENLYITTEGRRQCRACRRERERRAGATA